MDDVTTASAVRTRTNGLQALASIRAAWRNDVAAGGISSIISLPASIAAALLAFAPLGPDYAALAAAAGLIGAIVAGAVAALVANSSFIVSTPRASEALILASLVAALVRRPEVASDKNLILAAVYMCVFLGGLWQCLFGLAGVAKMIKFTPHPVLVGFLNGVAVLVIVSQLKPYFFSNPGTGNLVLLDRPAMFALCIAVAGSMLAFPALARRLPGSSWIVKIPPVAVGFFGGIAGFYLVKAFNRSLDLGPTLGAMPVSFVSPLARLTGIAAWHNMAELSWDIVPVSAILAIVATLDALLAFRAAQNVSDLTISPVRDVIAQGIGNCAAALTGGVTTAASPSSTLAACRAGGTTRLAPLTSAAILLVLIVFFPSFLAGIPAVVLSGILLALGMLLFDRWFFEIVADVRKAASALNRRRALYDVAVILIVMGFTIFYSVIAGVVAGCLMSGLIFVMNMSRPIVRRTFSGSAIQSKRIRPAKDVAILHETGVQRTVLQLEGVLFFGNADDLSGMVKDLFQQADMITLDMRGVSDMDVSGATVLASLLKKGRELKKHLLFCEIPSSHEVLISGLVRKTVGTEEVVKQDLDACLEWMEEKSLQLHADKRGRTGVLALSDIDFVAGIEEQALDRLREVLTQRDFNAGDIICNEGEDGDRMWLLAKGSVSVRLALPDGRGYRRIASLARGTTIGEMSLIEAARRSATIVADEPVICYELLRSGFDGLLADHPFIAMKLLSNLSRELARRLRKTSDELRNMS